MVPLQCRLLCLACGRTPWAEIERVSTSSCSAAGRLYRSATVLGCSGTLIPVSVDKRPSSRYKAADYDGHVAMAANQRLSIDQTGAKAAPSCNHQGSLSVCRSFYRCLIHPCYNSDPIVTVSTCVLPFYIIIFVFWKLGGIYGRRPFDRKRSIRELQLLCTTVFMADPGVIKAVMSSVEASRGSRSNRSAATSFASSIAAKFNLFQVQLLFPFPHLNSFGCHILAFSNVTECRACLAQRVSFAAATLIEP